MIFDEPTHSPLPWTPKGRAIVAGEGDHQTTIAEYHFAASLAETDGNVAIALAGPRLLASLIKRLAADEPGGASFTAEDLDEANTAIVLALGGGQ
jgi:hypothetical protein